MSHHVEGYSIRRVPAGHVAECEVCGDATLIRGGAQSSEQARELVAHRRKHWAARAAKEATCQR